MLFVIVTALVLSSIDEARGTYVHLPEIGGALRTYKTISSWDEAKQKCQDDGAVLASPATEELQKELRRLFNNTSYFIGLDARFQQNSFVSVEGVPLDDMPVSDMYDLLDLDQGQCLSMNQREIRVAQCTWQMPYVCYKKQTDHSTNQTDIVQPVVTTERIRHGYTYYASTGSSYKIYKEPKSWDDASATCETENAHLLVIDTDSEARLIKLIYTFSDSYGPHIGHREDLENGGWHSVTNKSQNQLYNVWEYSAPSGDSYHCVIFRKSGKIDNYNCNTKREFICEV